MQHGRDRAVTSGLTGLLLGAGCAIGWAQTDVAPTRFEGAVGLTVRQAPVFPGSTEVRYRATPAGFVRYGRFTFNGSGGFTTRAADEVERGLAAELARRGSLRLSVGLRLDRGRSASDSTELVGTEDIRTTVRARWSARWDPNPDWRVTAGVSGDLLGRGGGIVGDVGASRRWALGHGESLSVGVGLSAAGRRYMQNWHGVPPVHSQASGLPAFEASAGLRDLSVSAAWRTEFQAWGQPFGALVGVGHTWLLGSAADSPLARKQDFGNLTAAVVWRF
jgi:outer membrane scaffolding protein for murein synthesis (MipA/OmpV family)